MNLYNVPQKNINEFWDTFKTLVRFDNKGEKLGNPSPVFIFFVTENRGLFAHELMIGKNNMG